MMGIYVIAIFSKRHTHIHTTSSLWRGPYICIMILIDDILQFIKKLNYLNTGLAVPDMDLLLSKHTNQLWNRIFSVFLISVEPACNPVREGQKTTLSCDVNTAGCSSSTLLTWIAGGQNAL